jgi:hypothetical protein
MYVNNTQSQQRTPVKVRGAESYNRIKRQMRVRFALTLWRFSIKYEVRRKDGGWYGKAAAAR